MGICVEYDNKLSAVSTIHEPGFPGELLHAIIPKGLRARWYTMVKLHFRLAELPFLVLHKVFLFYLGLQRRAANALKIKTTIKYTHRLAV